MFTLGLMGAVLVVEQLLGEQTCIYSLVYFFFLLQQSVTEGLYK